MIVITVCSTKGGVGKTTLTANLGGFLADAGQQVLLVDADIQPTLSSYYPLAQRAGSGLHQLITTGRIAGTISRTAIPGLDIVVSDDPEGSIENWILHTPDGRVRMRSALRDLADYDVVLIDTQGAVGPLQDAGVLAADLLRLAVAAAQLLGCDDIIRPIDNGLGFLVDAVPAEVRESLPIAQRPALLCAWWLLVTVSEQFASHGMAEAAMPADWQDTPVGEAMARATQVEHWHARMAREKRADALLAVPYMPASNYAAYGLHRVTAEFFDTWTALLAITRQIYAVTDGQPWA